MAQLGCIALDLPAALELGALLADAGLRVRLLANPADAIPAEAEAVILPLPREAGVAEASLACERLLGAGLRQLLLLTPAGFSDPRIGPVADALRRRLLAGFALVVPGFPSRGRSVYLGHLFLGTALADGEPSLTRRLADWAGAPAALIPFSVVDGGPAAIRREAARLAEAGRPYGLADAVTDAQLHALAEGAAALPLLIGGAGLGLGLPAALRRAEILPDAAPEEWPAPRGAWAVLMASGARAALAQAGFARLHGPVLDLEAPDLAGALDRAVPLLSEEHPLVLAAGPGLLADPGAPAALAHLAEGLVARGVGRLLVAGEALFAPVLHGLCAGGLRVGPEVAEGTPWCVVERTGLQIAFKPGAAGGRDVLLRAFLPE